MSPTGRSMFILMLFPNIENNNSINIRITAIIPTIEMTFGTNCDTYKVRYKIKSGKQEIIKLR